MSAAANSNCPTASRAAGLFLRRSWLAGMLLSGAIGWPADPAGGITEKPLARELKEAFERGEGTIYKLADYG